MDRRESGSTDIALEQIALTGPADELPRVKSVKAGRMLWTLDLKWSDGSRDRVDLTGLVYRSRDFRRFLEEPKAFRRVKVVDWGAGIGWSNGLDYSADSLKSMAEEQRQLCGADLMAFEAANSLNTAETAALFDVSERTVREYREAERLPQPVALALRAMASNRALVDALYRPVERRPRGRPRKVASA